MTVVLLAGAFVVLVWLLERQDRRVGDEQARLYFDWVHRQMDEWDRVHVLEDKNWPGY